MSEPRPSASPSPAPDLAALKEKYPFHKRPLKKDLAVRIEVERATESITSSSSHLSPVGICFELPEPLEGNEETRVLLYLPRGKEMEILKVQTRAVWQEPVGEGARVGALITKYAPGDERRLRQWLIDLEKGPGKR
ncbi:MAG: PilZ domain-containing protein [Deltaproteobacteria bacterium]|nr:PilZ domain-containing protein [Deltaproteobacteria bacterium]